ncbi:MAG: CopD family protein [Flavobacteriales bacterium]
MLYVKALHIIFMVSWFAGLFYMVRLFIYFVEANGQEEPKKSILQEQLEIMQRRLWWIITTPAMILTIIFGTWMILDQPGYYLSQGWMQIKLGFVAVLIAYHFYSQRMMKQCQQRSISWSSGKLRLWNEGATLLLVAIVFLVMLKNSMNWLYGTFGFFGVAILLMIGIQFYKKMRKTHR